MREEQTASREIYNFGDNSVHMALTNFLITVGVLGAAAMLLRSDIRSSGKMLQRNVKTIRTWMEEAQEAAPKGVKGEAKQVSDGKMGKMDKDT